jgi:hypothetical protein
VQKQIHAKRYVYQATAIGVAGQIVHPFQDIIPVQASSALPAEGGFGSARAVDFRHKEVLSFGSAHSQVFGSQVHPDVSEALSVSVVEKFNLLDVVTCDRMVARLTLKFTESEEGSGPSEPYIVPIGSRFEKLRIGNIFFENLELAPDYFCQPERACWSGLLNAVSTRPDRDLLEPLSLPDQDGNPVPLPVEGRRPPVLGFCLALSEPEPGTELGAPLRFYLPQFGTVYLGEYFCYPNARSLTMLRADLGCPVQGNASVAQGRVGGEPYP